MSDEVETAAVRLWRDRVQLREHERDEARARARIAEEKVAVLAAENDRLADEIARLRALLTAAHPAPARAETEQQMEDLRTALLSQLDQPGWKQPSHLAAGSLRPGALTSRRTRWWSSYFLRRNGIRETKQPA